MVNITINYIKNEYKKTIILLKSIKKWGLINMTMKNAKPIMFILFCTCFLLLSMSFVSATNKIINSAHLAVYLADQNPDPAEPGEILELRFNVWNNGSGIIENVDFELTPEWPLSFVSGQSPKIGVGDLKGNFYDVYNDKAEDNIATLFYRLKVDPKAVTGDYQVKLEYSSPSKYGVPQKLPVFTVRVESSTSLLDIENFQTTPEKIVPGSSGKLYLKLANKGGVDLKDIKVKLDLDNVDISTLGSTNEKVISSIQRDHSTMIEYEILASGEMKGREYQIPVEITYEDDDNNEYTKNNTITILMDSTPDYLLNLEQSEIYHQNSKGKIVVSLSNTGQSDLKFLNFELLDTDNYEVIGKRSEYLGNLESDDYETADFQIFVKKVNFPEDNEKRNLPLKVKISYKDGYNIDYADEDEIKLPIYTKSAAKKYGLVNGGISGTKIFFILLIIAGIGYYIYRKKKGKNNNKK
ncbi:hypothetical protein HN695_03205 [Candidatus Woesearchaeota archaeon]|jgi:hypothetical protein|nr:hypothetical protein [Candidatus Woesearchaeota archaeon]MBT5271784.1 hypothetical protein [Candidatus Woesearchaeota archaeon]MBT6041175.1 hypothetical protein [Candidatus Woesearchaeota archaeon]MBT6336296.1 hypothetical protein [Candidatus Woesearchaeota archaeon]MBT7927318.1 hypothetical protein [Candidatus Woesearchaeota archaeon]